MGAHKKHLIQDVVLLAASIAFAVFIVRTGVAADFLAAFGGAKLLGVFLAGMFFTSLFTTPPAIALLGELSLTTPLHILALVGGLGAVVGDYVIFRFVKDRVSADFEYLFSVPRHHRAKHLLRTKLFRFFVPLLGALIIASPLPDEIAVVIMGLSKVRTRYFFVVSFLANGLGILAIGWIARSAAGL